MGILSLLFAVFKALPAVAGLIEKLMAAWAAHSAAERERMANARLEEKNAAVDAGIDAALLAHIERRMFDDRAAGEQQAADGAPGLPSGGSSGAGVVPGRAENDQRAGGAD